MDFKKLQPTGKCPVCGINCWAEYNNEPAIWPCGIEKCPYTKDNVIKFDRSSTGSSLSQIFYGG